MDKYIKTLISQIRCKKARPFIADEIRDHIECQIEDNIANGMTKEDAERNAIIDMGDPVEAGVSLDRIHRPQIAWRMLIIVGIISIIGVAIHYIITQDVLALVDTIKIHPDVNISNKNYYSGVLFGIITMMIIYFIDYSVIAKYSRIIGGVILAVGVFFIWWYRNDDLTAFRISGYRSLLTSFMMFYVPIYAAIVYKYRNMKLKGIICSLLWLMAPVVIAIYLVNVYLAFVLYVSMVVLLTIAVADGWFSIPKKRMVLGLCVILFLSPIILLALLYFGNFLAEYQKARIDVYLHPGNYDEMNYLAGSLREQLMSSVFIGSNGKEMYSVGSGCTSDFIFTYITGSYGILAAMIICAIITVLIIAIFAMATKQNNRVGMLMGCGCGMLFLVNAGINILENLGYLPLTQTFLPFLSSGRYSLILSYALVGIVMSIYRYKSVYPRHMGNDKRDNIKYS